MGDPNELFTGVTPERMAQQKRLALLWKQAAPFLEEQRNRDIRSADTVRAVENLAGLTAMAVEQMPVSRTSGLVEAQRWFMLARRRQESLDDK